MNDFLHMMHFRLIYLFTPPILHSCKCVNDILWPLAFDGDASVACLQLLSSPKCLKNLPSSLSLHSGPCLQLPFMK